MGIAGIILSGYGKFPDSLFYFRRYGKISAAGNSGSDDADLHNDYKPYFLSSWSKRDSFWQKADILAAGDPCNECDCLKCANAGRIWEDICDTD